MRHFVRLDFENTFLRLFRRFRRIEQKNALEIRNAAPVFHRAAETTGHGDQIKLRERVFYSEILVVIVQDLFRTFQRVTARPRFPLGRDDADLHAVRLAVNCVHLTRAKYDEVG